MAEKVINHKIQPKRVKAIDMRFNWLHNQEAQEQLELIQQQGKANYADYNAKHHSPTHHH